MVTKKAIIDPKRQERFKKACKTDRERILVWLMMDLGMHSQNVSKLSSKNISESGGDLWLDYQRAKNAMQMSAIVPKEIGPTLVQFVNGKKLCLRQYNNIIHKIGRRIRAPETSPMSLRKTCGINELREFRIHPDRLTLVARRMGCTVGTVTQYYLDLHEWEKEHGIQS